MAVDVPERYASVQVLIGAFLLGLRQLRWIQSLSDADAAVASELETVSDEKTGHWSTDPIPAEDLHWLTSSQYANGIRPGNYSGLNHDHKNDRY